MTSKEQAEISKSYSAYFFAKTMRDIAKYCHNEQYIGQTSSVNWAIVSRSLDYFHIKKINRIMDLGCGNGCFSTLLSKKYSSKIIGIDINHDLVQKAISSNYPRCKFLEDDFFSYQTSEKADLLLSIGSLYWVRDLKKALEKFRSNLVPKGNLVAFVNLAYKQIPKEYTPKLGATRFITIEELQSSTNEIGATFSVRSTHNEYKEFLNNWNLYLKKNIQNIYKDLGEKLTKDLKNRFLIYQLLAEQNIVKRCAVKVMF